MKTEYMVILGVVVLAFFAFRQGPTPEESLPPSTPPPSNDGFDIAGRTIDLLGNIAERAQRIFQNSQNKTASTGGIHTIQTSQNVRLTPKT